MQLASATALFGVTITAVVGRSSKPPAPRAVVISGQHFIDVVNIMVSSSSRGVVK
jgi:hypothetical protein